MFETHEAVNYQFKRLAVSWARNILLCSDDCMVEGGGFEPPKSLTTDLQSVPFGRSGIPPGMIYKLLCFMEPRIRIERITC